MEKGATRIRTLNLRGASGSGQHDSLFKYLSACTDLTDLAIDDHTYVSNHRMLFSRQKVCSHPCALVCSVQDQQWETFSLSIQNVTSLVSIGNRKLLGGIVTLATWLTSLQYLDITGCYRMTVPHLRSFAEGLKTTQLTDLNLRGVPKVDDLFLELLAPKCRQLRKINLELCNLVSDKGILSLAENCLNMEIFQCNKLVKITSPTTWIRAIKNWPRLSYLDLAECLCVDNSVLETLGLYSIQLWYLNLRACEYEFCSKL